MSAPASSSHITERITLATRVTTQDRSGHRGGRGKLGRRNREGEMKGSVRITLLGVFAAALMVLSPCSTPSAHAGPVAAEMNLNSSTVQVVHNTPANTDVLNLNLNVESSGDTGTCGDANDLLETGVHVAVSRFSCFGYFIACIGLTGCPVL